VKYREECPHCGQVVAAYTHNINEPMIKAFIKLVEHYDESHRPVNINTDLGLDHNQKCNLPKLQYYGLIIHTQDGWVPSELGYDFYYGEAEVLCPAATMGNQVLPDDHPAWKTHSTKRFYRSISDIAEYFYKKRPEYANEKNNQGSLF
jgi:hypothetical protein